ncbi:MAG: metallopeptidase family protein [Actinomycetia bacterium]|nr:metallopeptidase family protein [Actinomycetes bacterium]
MPSRRDRHQRGLRGPLATPGTSAAQALLRLRPAGPADFFVQCLTDALAQIRDACPEALVGVDVGLEDVPDTRRQWSDRVPLAAAQEATPDSLARIVVYRRPIEHRASDRQGLRTLVLQTLVEQVSALTGIPVERLDPDGTSED